MHQMFGTPTMHVEDIVKLEKVQRRAANWVMNNHGRYLLLSCFLSITYMTTIYNNTGALNPRAMDTKVKQDIKLNIQVSS